MGQSSLSSQTVLGGTDDSKYGSSWSAKRKLSTKRPRLPKIKSSAGHDTLTTTTSRFNGEDRSGGHKRGSSASATPTSPTYVPDYLLNGSGSFLPTAHMEHPTAPPPTRKKSTKMNIKPLLARKYSSREKVDPSIDLSRPAADNDGLAAALSEVNIPGASAFASPAMPARKESISQQRGGFHRRTTSATSQISTTTTASNRYVHPMRQTPRAYTPPIAGSYKTSFDSDTNTSTPITSDLDTSASTPFAALPTSKSVPAKHKLPHIRTKSSNSPRLTSSPSLTNMNNNPGTPSSLRNPPILSDTPFPDMVSLPSGTARSSLETASTFRKQRSRSNTAGTDPRSQAETVQHLRQKFQEKEAKKDAKWQEKEIKQQEKEARKRERKDSNARRSLEKRERKIASRNRSRATSKANSEKSSLSLATFGTRDGPFGSVGVEAASAGAGAGAGAGHQEMSQVPRPVDKDALGREMFGSDVQQLRNKRSGNLPRNHNAANRPPQQLGRSRAGTGTGSAEGTARAGGEKKREKVTGRWSLIWFRFKTFWLSITGGGKS